MGDKQLDIEKSALEWAIETRPDYEEIYQIAEQVCRWISDGTSDDEIRRRLRQQKMSQTMERR